MLDKLFIVLTVLFNFLIENYMFCTWTEKKYKITKRIVMFGFMIGLVYVITDYYFSVIIRSIIFNITELIIMKSGQKIYYVNYLFFYVLQWENH